MYKVFRCVAGVHSQNIGGEWATLREAYEYAQQAAKKVTTQYVRFRILGPHPRPMPRPRGEPAPQCGTSLMMRSPHLLMR